MSQVLESKSEKILEPPSDPDTYAFNLLRNEENMKLPIIPDKDIVEAKNGETEVLERKKQFVRLEELVEELYGNLEVLIDHQVEKAGQSGVRIKSHARRRLEGWDFKDLVSGNDPIYPLVETIQAVGKGWVDFIRSIEAVTLFGQGFGDIIEPRDEIYSQWRHIPEGSFYLAARVSDLKTIMETKNGDDMAAPRRVCDGISWFSPTPAFDVYQCSQSRSRCHSDPTQVLWPTSLTSRLPLTKRVPLHPEGAAIFGHNIRFKWRWGDNGDPVEGDPRVEASEHGSDHLTVTTSSRGSKSGEDQSTADTSFQLQATQQGSEEIGADMERPDSGGHEEHEVNGSQAFARIKSRRAAFLRRIKDKLIE